MSLRRLPSLSGIRAFEAAARRGSFKDAAHELSVTPGAISQHIKALEADLGVALFLRLPRSVQLTNAGQCLQPTLSEAFLQIRQALDAVRPPKAARMRINSSAAIISKWVLPRLHEFTHQNPEVQVFIETEAGLNAMQGDGPEVVIRYTRTPPAHLHSELLHRELLIPVVRPELAAQHNLTSAANLAALPILHDTSLLAFGPRTGWSLWSEHAQCGDVSELPNAITFARHAADQVIDAAASGAGIALARSFLAASALSDGRLTCPFGPVIPSGLSYFACCRAGMEQEPVVARFLSWAREEAAMSSTLNALGAA